MDVRIRLTGVKEIDDVLKGLPKQVNHKLLQQAHTQASKVLVEKAKLLAPEGENGDLVDSIGTVREGFAKASELGLVQTGPRRRRGRYKGHAGHLVEYGTVSRRNRSGANRGIMPKKPFMEPAWESTKDKVIGSINGFLGKALLNFMKRTIKRG
jgi:hypothetical protein